MRTIASKLFYLLTFLIINLISGYPTLHAKEISKVIKHKADSLQIVLSQTSKDENRLNIYRDLANIYLFNKADSTILYCDLGIQLSRQLQESKIRIRLLNWKAISYAFQGNHEKSIEVFEEALKLSKTKLAATTEEKVLDYFYEYLSLTYNNLGYTYFTTADYVPALDNLILGLKIAEKHSTKNIALLCGSFSELYLTLGNLEKAKFYCFKALDFIVDSSELVTTYRGIGDIYESQNKLDSAYIFYKQSILYAAQSTNKYVELVSKAGIARYHLSKKHFEQAHDLAEETLEIAQNLDYKSVTVTSLISLAKADQGLHRIDSSIMNANRAITIAKELKLESELSEAYKVLYTSYQSKGMIEEAFRYLQMYQQSEDHKFNEESSRKVANLETEYLLDQKETENQLLKEQQALNKATIRIRTIYFLAAILFFFLVSLIALMLYKNNKDKKAQGVLLEEMVNKRTRQLKQSKEELERFNFIISHDLKEPLRNIISFSSLIQRKITPDTDPNISDYLKILNANTRQLHRLITDVMEFTKIGKQEKKIEKVSLNEVIQDVKSALRTFINDRNASITHQHTLPVIQSYHAPLYLILKNLVENGIKYNKEEQPTIDIQYQMGPDAHYIKVTDNGIGIAAEYHKTIFGMFKRLHHRGEFEGTGLGLAISKKVIQQIGGAIEVIRSNENGTTILFTFPILNVIQEKKVRSTII